MTHASRESIDEKVGKWSRQLTSDDFYLIRDQIQYLSERLFEEYQPTIGPAHVGFYDRLENWINGAPLEEDQQLLLKLLPNLLFIGAKEYDSLYQAAFNGVIARWLIDCISTKLDDANAGNQVFAASKKTWFCAITDSMQIARFYHINNITGTDLRPDWQSLNEFGCKDKIYLHMLRKDFERLVLLEDFVGSGEQMEDPVRLAASLGVPMLVCPLVVCPGGLKVGKEMENDYSNLRFDPVFVIPESEFVSKTARKYERPLYKFIRQTVKRLHRRVMGNGFNGTFDYGAFGLAGEGGLVVMHTNCPDNTLPVIHHESDGPWYPIFPRSSRL